MACGAWLAGGGPWFALLVATDWLHAGVGAARRGRWSVRDSALDLALYVAVDCGILAMLMTAWQRGGEALALVWLHQTLAITLQVRREIA